jgi:hypothetical protein
MALFVRSILAGSALLAAAATLGAQAPATAAKPACDVTDALKGNVAKASLNFDIARQASPSPIAATKLKDVVKTLETADKGDDPTARAYVMGEALSLWLNQPGVGPMPKRGAVGFTTNPDATIDLVGSVDSLFRIVETAKPDCGAYTAYYRGGQKYFLDVANNAINALNANNLDSAEYYATQANRLYPGSPYGAMVLGNVYSKRNDTAKALQYWTTAADIAAKDTVYRDVRRQMLANAGAAYLTQANGATGAAKTAAARHAAEAYSQLIAVPGTSGAYLSTGRQSLQAALLMAGDTAAFVNSYQALAANPSQYESQDLLNSAVNAARANRSADAAKLFEGVLVQNPYSRDALFNASVTYLATDQNEKVAPLVNRLVVVDPGNPENYNNAARAYLALSKQAKAKKNSALERAYNDSATIWYTRGNKLPVEVTFSEFSPSDKQLVVAGTVLDRRDKIDAPASAPAPKKGARAAAKPGTAPKAVTLKFEALDKSGTVVGTQSVTTESLTPGKSASFRVTIPATNAVGYRYTIGE